MTAQPLEEFLNNEFLEKTAAEIGDLGFLTDEHDFAPYRETLSVHLESIETALKEIGLEVELLPGFVKHKAAGFAYFIYDSSRFEDSASASEAVLRWLDKAHGV